jgi:hypothetical protein
VMDGVISFTPDASALRDLRTRGLSARVMD